MASHFPTTKNKATTNISFFDVFRFAARYWRRQPKRLAIICVFLLAAAGVETYLPTALSNFLTAIRQHSDENNVLICLGVFIGAYLLQTMIFSLAYRTYNVFETFVFKDVIDDAFTHVYRLSEHFFVNTFTGSIVSKINRGRQQIERFEDQVILRIFPTIVVLLSSTGFLALHFPMLAVLLIVYLIVLAGVSAFFVFHVSGPAQGIYADAQDHYTANLADSVGSIATTKAYAQEEYELERFFDITHTLRVKNTHAYVLSNTAAFAQRLLLTGMLALLLGGGTWYLFHGKAGVESMAYLAFAYTIMQAYIRDLGENIKNILTSSYELHAVINLLREKPEVVTETQLPELVITQGAITFENITFTYPGKTEPVFKNLSVSIRAGERVALVGHSGSGKTTFVRLLQALYTAQEGRILIDRQNITDGSRASLRSAIALVPQDPILFHRSLRDNIAYAKPMASMQDIENAAQQAHIAPFVHGLPQRYDTLVGERGVKLSGGERQRIAIARAILADRPILVLDEATSSLDSESERAIQGALLALTHSRTSIMIAHRLSTIIDADRILVFDRGRIVEEGTHADLVQRENGIYAGFFKLQSGGFLRG